MNPGLEPILLDLEKLFLQMSESQIISVKKLKLIENIKNY